MQFDVEYSRHSEYVKLTFEDSKQEGRVQSVKLLCSGKAMLHENSNDISSADTYVRAEKRERVRGDSPRSFTISRVINLLCSLNSLR